MNHNTWLMFAGALLATSACSSESEPSLEETKTDALYAESNKIWHRPIRVCWNFDGWDREKGWVRDAVEGSWMHETNVEFHDWARCPAWDALDDYDYMIDVLDARPHSGVGTDEGQILVNFAFHNWSTKKCRANEGMREHCIKNIAVHEFGHAMGFAHEQNRADDPGCDAERDGYGNWALTSYDRESVMNYQGNGPGCNPRWGNDGQLSPLDIKGARSQYGAKLPGSLVGFGGNCLDVAWGGTHDGADVQMYDCNAGSAQRWRYDQASGAFFSPGNKALDIAGISSNNGAPVQLWSFWGGENQRWGFRNVEIRHFGKCLDRGNQVNGTQLTLQFCHGGPSQKWELSPSGELKNAVDPNCGFFCGDRKCMEVKDFAKHNFAPIVSWSCWGGENQRFKIMPGGELRVYSGAETKCVDVLNTSTTDGTPVILHSCHGGDAQKFSLRGNVVAYSGNERQGHRSCLDVWGFGRTNHSDVTIYDCHGGLNQVFEYYP